MSVDHVSTLIQAGGEMRKGPDIAEAIRRTAYFLWQHDGELHGRSLHYWLRAKDMHMRQLAYDKWLAEGTPIGRADEHWSDAVGDVARNEKTGP